MPKSGKHLVNNIDSFFRVRPSSTNIREGETVSFLEKGKLIKQEKRNGIVYEQEFTQVSPTLSTDTDETGNIHEIIAGAGLTGGGFSGEVTLDVVGGTGIIANADDIAIDSTVVTLTGTQNLSNKTLASPTFTGTAQGASLTLTGDLTVQGDTTTLNTATLQVEDNNIVLNYLDGDSSSTADGAGITIQDAVNSTTDATILWSADFDRFNFSHAINVTGNISVSGTVDGVDIAARDHDNVTLAGSLDYITLSGQEITRNAINLTTDVTGTLPVSSGGTGATTLTSNALLTGNGTSAIQGESGLTYDGSTLAVTGDQTISGVLKHSSNGDNRLTLDDDSDSGLINQVTLAGVNNVNILIDGTNNGTGDFQVRARPTTANDLDTASTILDMNKVIAVFNQDTSQQFQIGSANRFKIQEEGAFVQNGSLGVGLTPISDNARIQATSHIEAGVGSGAIGLTINDGGGNSNVTFNHTGRVPEQNGNSGRIEVNTDGIGAQYMAFELAGNVTSGVAVSTTEIARIDSTGLQSSLSGTAANPALRVNDSDTGLYRIADNKLGISTAGTFAVAVDASQNVGIGTTNPDNVLHVKHATTNVVAKFESGDTITYMNLIDNASDTYGVLLGVTGNDFHVTTGSSTGTTLNERLRVSSTGAITFNNAYTFPTSDGSGNQILRTNGSGTLSFATFSVGIDQILAGDIQTSSELVSPGFSDNDDSLMTAAAINDRIESFGYGTGTMSSWTLEGDSGSTTVTNANTVDIAGGTGITTVASLDAGRDTVTINFSAGIDDLSDVSINSGTLANGHILQYSSGESAWANVANPAITMSGSTTNGVLTRNTSTQATVESNLTFDGTRLSTQDIDISGILYMDNSTLIDTNRRIRNVNSSVGADLTGGTHRVDFATPATPGSTGWYTICKASSANARGGGIINLSVTGGSLTPTTLTIDFFVDWGGSLVRCNTQGHSGQLTKLRLIETASTTELQIYVNTTVAQDVYMSFEQDRYNPNYTLLSTWTTATPTVTGDEISLAGVSLYSSNAGNNYLRTSHNIDMNPARKLSLDGGNGTYIHELSDNVIEFRTDNNPQLKIDNNAGVIINDGSYSSFDFRVESNDIAHMLFVDSGANKIAIGNTTADATLHIGHASSDFSLGGTSGDSVDNLKLESSSANANQLIFSTERISNGSDWTTSRERIRRRVDVTDMGYIEFGSSFSDASDMISFGRVGTGKFMGIGGGTLGRVTIGPDQSDVFGMLTIAKDAHEEHLTLKTNYANFNTPRGAIKWRDGVNVTGAIHTEYDGTDVSMRFGSLYNAGYNTNTLMTLTGQGQLGIGTQSPGRQLTVYGEGVIRVDSASGDPGIDFNTAGTSDMQIRYRGASDKLQVYSYGTSSNVMTINKSNGFVGIGTESPNTLMHLYSTSNTQLRLQTTGTGNASNVIYQNGSASYTVGINSAEQFSFYSSQLGADAGFINTNGNLYWNYNFLANNNNYGLVGRDTGGNTRVVAKINSSNQVQIGDNGHGGNHIHYPSTYTQINTDSGYIRIGPQNTSWSHIYTDRQGHLFDKNPTSLDGKFQSYSNVDLNLRRSQGDIDRLLIQSGISTFSTGLHVEKGLSVDPKTHSLNSDARYHINVLSHRDNTNRTGAFIIDTDIARTSNRMSVIHVHGHGYGDHAIIDFKVCFYPYSGNNGPDGNSGSVINYSLTDNGNDGKRKFVGINSSGNVAIAIDDYNGSSKYFWHFQVDWYNGTGAVNTPSWSVSTSTTDGFGWIEERVPRAPIESQRTGISTANVRINSSLGVNVNASGTAGRADFANDVVAFSTSDERLKENVKPLDNALDKVLQISGVEFDWKELTEEEKKTIHGNEGHDVGVIAQEIEEVLPEVVTTRDSGYKAVKYEKIVPLLIEAIKEQQKQIEELKNG